MCIIRDIFYKSTEWSFNIGLRKKCDEPSYHSVSVIVHTAQDMDASTLLKGKAVDMR